MTETRKRRRSASPDIQAHTNVHTSSSSSQTAGTSPGPSNARTSEARQVASSSAGTQDIARKKARLESETSETLVEVSTDQHPGAAASTELQAEVERVEKPEEPRDGQDREESEIETLASDSEGEVRAGPEANAAPPATAAPAEEVAGKASSPIASSLPVESSTTNPTPFTSAAPTSVSGSPPVEPSAGPSKRKRSDPADDKDAEKTGTAGEMVVPKRARLDPSASAPTTAAPATPSTTLAPPSDPNTSGSPPIKPSAGLSKRKRSDPGEDEAVEDDGEEEEEGGGRAGEVGAPNQARLGPSASTPTDASTAATETPPTTAAALLALLKLPPNVLPAQSSLLTQALNSQPQPNSQPEPEPTSSPLLTLPPELLAEILLYTSSTRAVLSVAMTCRALCRALLDPGIRFVWWAVGEGNVPVGIVRRVRWEEERRRGRQNEEQADGEEGAEGEERENGEREREEEGKESTMFGGEVGYAAFLFAGGECEVCHEYTHRSYRSYALRIRLCYKLECETTFVTSGALLPLSRVVDKYGLNRALKLVPVVEDKHVLKGLVMGTASGQQLTRKDLSPGLRAFLVQERSEPDFREKWEAREKKVAKWMEFCRQVLAWKRKTRDLFYEKKKANEVLGKTIAQDLGWDYNDMMSCTDYGPYHRNKNHVFEDVRRADVNVLAPTITTQLERLADKRDRQVKEVLYQENRAQIIEHYNYLKRLSDAAAAPKKPASSSAGGTATNSNANNNNDENQADESKTAEHGLHVFPVFPALSAFRQLSVIQMLQDLDVPSADSSCSAPAQAKAKPKSKKAKAAAQEKSTEEGEGKGKGPKYVSHIAKSLREDEVMGSMLKKQVDEWVERARGGLWSIWEGSGNDDASGNGSASGKGKGKGKGKGETKGGRKPWKSVSKMEVHPVERMGVRFRCKRCEEIRRQEREKAEKVQVEGGREGGSEAPVDVPAKGQVESFNFRTACAHDCSKPGKKQKGNHWKWDAGNFVKDEQASNAVSKYLQLCELDDKSASCAETVAVLDGANHILCMSCEFPVIMKYSSLVAHSHRHPSMDFHVFLCHQSGVIGARYPFRAGFTKKLLQPGPTAAEARERKVYGCRICYMNVYLGWLHQQRQQRGVKAGASGGAGVTAGEDGAAEAAGASTSETGESQEPAARLFSFDGVRSHLKSKHAVVNVADEDYFCSEVPAYLVIS